VARARARVTVDTNVLVSGLLTAAGPPGRVVDLIVGGRLSVLYDDRILGEYEDVLRRPRFDFDSREVQMVVAQIRARGELIVAEPLDVVLPDADDLPFLEVAAAGGARALITGNPKHYKPTRGAHTVAIKSPRDFITELSAR
jgi:putative PIN family toxin of toxin-antitoxin system